MKKLVDKSFWQSYWRQKKIKKIGRYQFFNSLFDNYLRLPADSTVLEVGGYPGTYSIFLKKKYRFNTTFVDYLEDVTLLRKMEGINGLNSGEIVSYKADFLKFSPKKKFDAVISFGFVEHFDDYGRIIERHFALCKDGGTVLIAIPNFLGINGSIQEVFDPDIYKAHNLESMKYENLQKCMQKIQPREYTIFYYGGFLVWLEKMRRHTLFLKLLFMGVNGIGRIIKMLGINNQNISPYIVIAAKK